MKKLCLLFFVMFFMQLNVTAQNGWKLIHSFGREVGCIAFKDSLNGFVAAAQEPVIYKTTDGGITWNVLGISNLTNKITKIIFVNDNFFIGVGGKGTVIKSIDGGKTWEVKNIGDSLDLKTVYSAMNGSLFAAQWSGNEIYKSTDRGETWTTPTVEGFLIYCHDFAFISNEIGYGVGEPVIKTTDGGDTWVSVSLFLSFIEAIKFVSKTVGYIFNTGEIAKTMDGGNTWQSQYKIDNYYMSNSRFLDLAVWNENIVWAAGADIIVKTTNGGLTWHEQPFSPYHYLLKIQCVDSLICFAIGFEGAFYKTTNGGFSAPALVYPPDSTINLTLTFTLTWDNYTDGELFRVHLAKDSDFNEIVVDTTLTGKKLQLKNLLLHTEYFWRVQEILPNLISSWSAPSKFETTNGAPVLSQPLNNLIDLPIILTFRWKDVTLAANSFQLQLSTDSSFINTVYDNDKILNDSVEVTNLALGVLYYWRVRAKINNEYGDWSNIWSFKTLSKTPRLISPINNSVVSPINLSLQWSNTAETIDYKLQIATDSLFKSNVIDQDKITGNSLTVNLSYDTKYFWRVGANDINEQISWSNYGIFKTKLPPKASFPLNIGNKWYYQASSTRDEYYYGIVKEITDTLNNGFTKVSSKYYYKDSIATGTEYWAYIDGKFYINNLSTTYYNDYLTKDTCIYSSPCWHLVEYEIFDILDTAQIYISSFFPHGFGSSHSVIMFPQIGIVGTEDAYSNIGSYIEDSTYLIGLNKDGIIYGDTIIVPPEIYDGPGWTLLNSGTTNKLNGICSVGNYIASAVGNSGTILRTTDGGITWISQNSGTTEHLTSVFFIDANLGIVLGTRGTILRTTNGGETWLSINSNEFDSYGDLSFPDSKNGFIIGDYTFLKTSNSGLTWTQKSIEYQGMKAIDFADSNFGLILGYYSILTTTNGGTSWIYKQSVDLRDVFLIDKDNGIVVGSYGTILRTTDGGVNWISQLSGTKNFLLGVFFSDPDNGIIVGVGGKILRTTNGGAVWIKQPNEITNNLNDVILTDANNGWIVGDSGIILHTQTNTELISKPLFPLNNSVDIPRTVELKWTKAFGAQSYELQISTDFSLNQISYDYKNLKDTSLTVDSLSYSSKYYWRIKTLGTNGEYLSQIWNFTTISLLTKFDLYQNYPNPFNSATQIKYDLPKAGFVTLKVYDVLGREIETLVNEEKPAGNYEVKFNGNGLSSGIYFYKIQAGNNASVKKMILMK